MLHPPPLTLFPPPRQPQHSICRQLPGHRCRVWTQLSRSPGPTSLTWILQGPEHERIHFIYSTLMMEIAPKTSLCLLSYFLAKASQRMLIISPFFSPPWWIIDFQFTLSLIARYCRMSRLSKMCKGESFGSALGGWGGKIHPYLFTW